MGEKTLNIGQEVGLENAIDALHHISVQGSDTPIHREIECYGAKAKDWIEAIRQESKEQEIELHEVVCCEADAIIILTWEKGWKEIELRKVLQSDSILDDLSEGCKLTDKLGYYIGS